MTPEAKNILAHDLVMSLENLTPEAIQEFWLAEAELRDTEMDEGRAKELPGDDVLARLRAKHP